MWRYARVTRVALRRHGGIRSLHFLFTLRGKDQVNTKWQLFCLVHNIEKLARSGWRR
jgi:hypothetical protein